MAIRNKIVIEQGFEDARATMENVAAAGVPPGANIIYSGRRNTLFTLAPGELGNPFGLTLNVKAFRVPPHPNEYVYRFLRDGKAKKSFNNARELLRLGFRTPQPVGYCERHIGVEAGGLKFYPRLGRSFYFCEHLPLDNVRDWEKRPDRKAFVAAIAKEMVRLHRAGVWVKDFSPGNVLCNVSAAGEYEFYLVDVNRIEFNVFDRRKLMNVFRCFVFDRDALLELADAYAKAAGVPAEEIRAAALSAHREYLAGARRKERLKRLVGR